MPGVNGLEAIPRIRALNNPPAILVLSMHDEAQMAARALKVGAAGYATKDSDPALLLMAIRTVAAGGRSIAPELADRMVLDRKSVGEGKSVDVRVGLGGARCIKNNNSKINQDTTNRY